MSTDGLTTGLAAEYEAVYVYSSAGPHVGDRLREAVQQGESDHRDRRDAVLVALDALGTPIPPTEAGYALPEPIVDEETAVAAISDVEERAARAWRSVLPDLTGDERRLAAQSLAGSAITAVRWRRAIGDTPITRAFPGRQ